MLDKIKLIFDIALIANFFTADDNSNSYELTGLTFCNVVHFGVVK